MTPKKLESSDVKKTNFRRITIDVPVDLLERIDKVAVFGGLSRLKLILNLLEVGIDCLESTKKVGILSFVILFRDLEENFKKWAQKIEKTEIKGLDTPI